MKRTICIGLTAAIAFACGGRDNDSKSDTTAPPSAQSGSATPSDVNANAAAPNQSEQLVTLTGCLQGGDSISGSGAASGSAGAPAGGHQADNTNSGRFVLSRATPGIPGADVAAPGVPAQPSPGTGVGANGAGGSGGPLVSGTSSYGLVGNSAELREHLNHEVRITGRLSSATTAYEQSTRSMAGSPAPSASSGTAGSGAGAGTSGTARQPPTASDQSSPSGLGMRTVTVESVQMVAATCSSR
jgi:hypothetical protein